MWAEGCAKCLGKAEPRFGIQDANSVVHCGYATYHHDTALVHLCIFKLSMEKMLECFLEYDLVAKKVDFIVYLYPNAKRVSSPRKFVTCHDREYLW